MVYQLDGQNDKALEWMAKSLDVAREEKDSAVLAVLCNNMSLIYTKTDQHKQSLFYLKQAQLFVDKDNISRRAVICNNISTTYLKLQKPEEALESAQKGLELHSKVGYGEGIATSYNLMAQVYEQTGKEKQAFSYYKKALKEAGKKEIMAPVYAGLADLFFTKRQYDSARYYAQQALIYLKKEDAEAKRKAETVLSKLNFIQGKSTADKPRKSLVLEEQQTSYPSDYSKKLADLHLQSLKIMNDLQSRANTVENYENKLKKSRQQFDSLYIEQLQNRYKKEQDNFNIRQLYEIAQAQTQRADSLQNVLTNGGASIINYSNYAYYLTYGGLAFVVLMAIGGLIFFNRQMNVQSSRTKGLSATNQRYQKLLDNLETQQYEYAKQYEESLNSLAHKEAALSELAYFIAHKVRGPLATIQGLLYLMEQPGALTLEQAMTMLNQTCQKLDTQLHVVSDMIHTEIDSGINIDSQRENADKPDTEA